MQNSYLPVLYVVRVMLLVSVKWKTVFQTDTLYSCLLSLVSLSLISFSLVSLVSWSLSHTPILVYICFIATENSSVFNPCVARSLCNTITFIPSADHSLIRSSAPHSHSTDHSFIPQAHALHSLSLLSSFPNLCVVVPPCSLDFFYPVCSLSLWLWFPILYGHFHCGLGLPSSVLVCFPVVLVYHPVCWCLSLWSWSTILCVGLFPCGLGLPSSVLVFLPVVLVYHLMCWSLSLWSWSTIQCVGLSLWSWSTIQCVGLSFSVVLVYYPVCWSLSLWSWSIIQCVGLSFPVVLVYHPVCWSLSLWSWSTIQCVGLSLCSLGLPSVCYTFSQWSGFPNACIVLFL